VLISAVRIENVRGFAGAHGKVDLSFSRADGKFPRWIVVAGRNGAGKSTFLQAIALTIAGPSIARIMAESFAGWISNGTKEAHAATRLQFADADGFTTGRPLTFAPWAALRWVRQEAGPEPSIYAGAVGGNWTASRGPWAENPRGWFLAGYGPFRRLSPAPTEAQRVMMLPGRPSALASLFREEASLSEAVQWLQQVYLRRLEVRPDAERIERAVLRLLNDGLLPEGMRVLSVSSDGLLVRTPSNAELSLQSLSDGYRTVAALVLDIVKQLINAYGQLSVSEQDDGTIVIRNEGVVLIDEIDVHLHVSWQQRIGFWLKAHFPNLQFIVTTHSPFICQAADEGGLIRLPAPGENATAEIVNGDLFKRVVNGSADEAVLSDLFGLETSYSHPAALLREELATLEAATSEGAGLDPASERRLNELQETLPSSPSEDVARALNRLVHRTLE
jgi:energy-coupling factor transporter ATP-binding protein EcfA2